jgi:xylulose-5-phosphate/fructose-6-phosphate phosphoketolase
MPGEVIDRPNPQASPSNIPDAVNELAVKLEKIDISENDLRGLEEFRRASNYIAAGKYPATKKPSPNSNGTSYDFPCR